ncbi:MAG TPA: hypothetical protein VFR37_18730 [Longimicrobium sp.]|nr:hypothetical protein [Longimicrobium sp.]
MITQKAAAVIELAAQKKQARDVADRFEGFSSRARQVQDEVTRLEPLVATWRVLRAHGIPVQSPAARVQAALARVDEARSQYRADPLSVLENWYRPASDALQAVCRDVDAELRSAWRRYVAGRIPSVNADLLDVLQQVPTFRHPVEVIRQRLRELRDQQEQLPASAAALEAVDRRVSEIDAAWHKLTSDEVPSAVIEFLRQAGVGGAPLSLLTDEVRDWLVSRRIDTSFRIRLGGERGY